MPLGLTVIIQTLPMKTPLTLARFLCLALLAGVCGRTALANPVVVMNPFVSAPPLTPPDTFVDFSGPPPVQFSDSFFDIFTEIDLVTSPPSGGLFDAGTGTTLGLRRIPPSLLFPPEVIPIELVALHLVSAQPIVVTKGVPGEQWNVVSLSLFHQGPSSGTTGADLGNDNFRIDSFFDIFVELTIEPVGGDPSLRQTITRPSPTPIQVHVPDSGSSFLLVLLGTGLLMELRRRLGTVLSASR